jgi:CheY-like chemotaxis protein
MPKTNQPDLGDVHVLVLDDNEDTRIILQTYLTYLGASVTTASTAREALTSLAQQRPHVIVGDLSMPGVDGLEFMRRVRQRPSEKQQPTPAIAITGFVRAEDRQRAKEAGYQAFIGKPFDPGVVAHEVARLVMTQPRRRRSAS